MVVLSVFSLVIMCFVKESIKYEALVFGIIFLLTGVALISIGVIYEITFDELNLVIPQSYKQLCFIPHLTIATGILVTVATFLGYGGALFNNRCLLFMHSILLITVFFFQLFVAIFTFLSIQDEQSLSRAVIVTTTEVFQNQNNSQLISLLQTQLHCCGTYGPSFWNETLNVPFPSSCCTSERCEDTYIEGCEQAVFIFLVKAAGVVGIALLALLETVVGAALAVCVGINKKDNEVLATMKNIMYWLI